MVIRRGAGRTGGGRFDLERLKAIPMLAVAADLGFRLSPRGGGRCRLPGHNDANPSFSVRGNRFRCFACGEKGDIIRLVMVMRAMDFLAACRWLSVHYLEGDVRIAGRPRATMRTIAHPTPTSAPAGPLAPNLVPDPEVYAWILDQSPLHANGRTYLESRGFSPQTLAHFQVGQVNDRRDLLNRAVAFFNLERLRRCGLLTDRRSGPEFVFPSGYLLFPFISNGKIAYLQARRADHIREWRWFCPAELLPPMFNLDVLSGQEATIAICEGVTDVLSAHQLGIAAIGLVGAGARPDAAVIASLAGRNVSACGDADKAGASLAQGLIRLLSPHGITVARMRLPAGLNDLNDFLRYKQGMA